MASPLEENGKPLNGYEIEHMEPEATLNERRVLVRCTNGGEIRAGAIIKGGKLTHVAAEPSQYGQEALEVLAIAAITGRLLPGP